MTNESNFSNKPSIYDPHINKFSPITFTESAIAHIKRMVQKEKINKKLRLSLKKSGCSGFSYVIDLVDKVNSDDVSILIDPELTLFIEKQYFPSLNGLHIDYVRNKLNSVLIFTNPNEKGRCGCGESFSF